MEYQAVLLAGSQGTALYPLCEKTPPCLLTVATRPLLHYQLDYLERSGFTECIIVTRTTFLRQLSHSLDSWKTKRGGLVTVSTAGRADNSAQRPTPVGSPTSSNSSASSSASSFASFSPSPPASFTTASFHIALEHVDQWTGTCAALRHLRPLLHSDFFCLQSDLLSNVPLHHLADIHRSRQAAVTMLVVDGAREREREAGGKKKKKEEADDELDVDYMGVVDQSPLLAAGAS